MQAFWIKLSSHTFYKIQNPKREIKAMRSPYKCLKSSLVLIKGVKSEQFYIKEPCVAVCFVFHVMELPSSISGRDGTDPPKTWQLLACL